jgi:hypothetical protein
MAGIAVVEILVIRISAEEAPLLDPRDDRPGGRMGLAQLRDIGACHPRLFGRLAKIAER